MKQPHTFILVLPGKNKGAELYDLSEDRSKKRNIAEAHLDKVMELIQRINMIVTDGRTTPGAIQKNDTGYWGDLAWMTEEEYGK